MFKWMLNNWGVTTWSEFTGEDRRAGPCEHGASLRVPYEAKNFSEQLRN
jgi:hypothetical protein